MAVSEKIEKFMTSASWIRKMFEEGIRMKAEFGAENVYDFSLGNPIMEPPQEYLDVLKRLINDPPGGLHRYMPNAGHPEVRAEVAAYLVSEFGKPIEADDVIMTSGAGGALNVALKSLLDPGDEVIVVAPFFPEYRFYADNHGGKLVVVESSDDFMLDMNAMENAVSGRTKAVILNSPNNPSGVIYDAASLARLGELLKSRSESTGRPITILSDDPYRKIVYDGEKPPSIFDAYSNTILITSHSKDLGLPGERIGYAAISPGHADREALRGAMTFANRTLGFVNAPALFQYSVAEVQAASVPVDKYQELRDLFCKGLDEAGIEYVRPQGAFYIFPRSPAGKDDMAFVRALQEQRILAVPGSGFGRAGHFRLSFCVTREEIEKSLPGFKKAVQSV